jgi:uncharacterized membrane protein YGL010W
MLDYARLSADYETYHTTAGNRRAHAVGIPLIVFAVVKWTQIGSFFPLAALALPVYFMWDRRIGWIMTGFIAFCALLGAYAPAWTAWAAFIVGWAFQIYGHKAHEKNSPALLDNLAHALIGPAFVAEKLLPRC